MGARTADRAAVPPAARSFGPTSLIGVAGAGLTCVAATRTWASASGSSAGVHVRSTIAGSTSAPLAISLALVALAAWGVVLVLRARPRRLAAAVGLLASVGVLVTVAASVHRAGRDAVHSVVAEGATSGDAGSSLSGWYFVCGAAALVTVAAFVVAVRDAPRWPAMSSRYDAPTGRQGAQGSRHPHAGPATEQDMWRDLDAGRDPTS